MACCDIVKNLGQELERGSDFSFETKASVEGLQTIKNYWGFGLAIVGCGDGWQTEEGDGQQRAV